MKKNLKQDRYGDNMKIGIDVDGVLTDIYNYQIEKGQQFFNKTKGKNTLSVMEMFDVTSEEEKKFWTKYIWEYCLKVKAREGASEALQKLKDEGNKIYIITSRVHTTKKNVLGLIFRKMLVFWLKDNKIPYDKIIYCNDKKSDLEKYLACKNLGIDYMIDDDLININSIKTVSKAICFSQPYNSELEDYRVEKINDFEELDKKIRR